jgi:hypothetical protein
MWHAANMDEMADNLSDQPGRPKRPQRDPPWTIKSMAQAEREAALSAAARADMSVGEWLAEAIRFKIGQERLPAVQSDNLSDPLQALASIAVATAQASQRPLPRSVSRVIYRQVLERMNGGTKPAARSDNLLDHVPR